MGKLLSGTLFALVVLVAFLLAGPTSLGGSASYVIVDGESMEPTYQHGDLVVAYERSSYDVGDVIVYDANVAGQFNVVHRIVERTHGGFVTQGDNVPEVDLWIAEDEHVYGSVVLHVPRGGEVLLFVRQPAVILALFAGWFAFEVIKARERSKRERSAEQGKERMDDLETVR